MTSEPFDPSDISLETAIETICRLAESPGVLAAMTPLQLMAASEVAYRSGDFHTGVVLLQSLVANESQEATYHSRLALFQRLAGDRESAEANFRHALLLDPKIESAYHELRELMLARNDLEGALALLDQQQTEFGATVDLRLLRIALLRRCGRLDTAVAVLQPLLVSKDAPEDVLRMAMELAFEGRRYDEAIRHGSVLLERYPHVRSHRIFLAHVLCADRRFDAAIPLLRDLLESDPDNIELLRLLSTALAESGHYREALQVAMRTTQLSPGTLEFWYHASALAGLLGQSEDALEWIDRAIALDPANLIVLTAKAHVLALLGRLNDAVAVLDEARHCHPSETSLQDLRVMLLTRIGEEFVVTEHGSDLIKPLPVARRRTEHDGGLGAFFDRLRIQCRVIIALVERELSHRTVYSRFGLLSALIEPVMQIIMLGVVLSIFNAGRPPIGDNLFFFYATGVLPFYLMLHIVDHTLNIFTDNAHLLQVSRIRRTDLVIAVALTELLIGSMTTVLIFTLFFAFGYGETTENIATAIFAYFFVWLFAFGVGFIGAVINNLTKMWQQSWTTVSRILYFISGIFFIPRMMPDWARDIVVWNPLLVGIEWFRSGFFIGYSPPWIDKSYLIASGMACVVIGAVLERALRRRLKTIQ